MSNITSTNKDSYKQWIRQNKDFFGQQILTDYVGIITSMLTSSNAGVTNDRTKHIKIITFDNGETVDITNKVFKGDWIYLPGLPNDTLTLKNGTNTETLSFNSSGTLSKSLNDVIKIGNKEFKVIGLGGGLIEGGDSPGYTITQTVAGIGTTSVTEGQTIIFEVNAVGIDTSIQHYWTTAGNTEGSDFTNSTYGSLDIVGLAVTTNGIGTITRTLTASPAVENEEFHLVIRTGSQWGTHVAYSSTITVNDLIPIVNVGVGTTSVTEGESIEFTINTNDVEIGQSLWWDTLGDLSSADWTDNDPNDHVTIVSTGSTTPYTGIATVTRTLKADGITETGDTFWLRVSTNSGGQVVGYSSTITVIDAVPTATITADKTTVNEGDSVVFTVSTTNMSPNSTLYYSHTGTTDSTDFYPAGTTGNFTIDSSGNGTITRVISGDFTSEGTEDFTLTVRSGSTTGTALTTAPTVQVTNTVPTFTTTPSATTIDEGDTLTMTVNTTGLHAGKVLYYSIEGTGVSPSDFTNNSLTGYFDINSSGVGTFNVTLDSDRVTEGGEVFVVRIRDGSTTGAIVHTSVNITINDTSLSPGANANGLTFGPVQVNRDQGNSANTSDWYDICSIDNLPSGSSIALFIDVSGSMTMSTIQASYDLLVQKLNAKGITITSVTNPNEDWITPFLVDLP